MKIRLDSARVEPFQWQETLELSPAELGLEGELELSPVAVSGSLAPAPPAFLLRAQARYRQTVSCDRCLTPVGEDVALPIELVVEELEAARGEEEDEQPGQLVVEDVIDTRPIVVEQVQLNLPTRPLCRPDCAGLCPRCGRNRNDGPCGCSEPEGDPRWGALAALKNDDRA
jgi:uncharacterized protein